jgi:diphthine-ammonia ligase
MRPIKDNSLIPEGEWISEINKIRQDALPGSGDYAEMISRELERAVASRIPKDRFGILLSGGVDSSLIALICKKRNADFICYTVGLPGSSDLEAARYAASKLGLDLRAKEISPGEAEGIILETAKILSKGTIDVVTIGVGAVELSAIRLAKGDNVKSIFTGLGSEEIFAGYDRHGRSADINEECWTGLKAMWGRDLIRDSLISKAMGVSFLTPFLDRGLISAAMSVPGEIKIKDGIKKYVLRMSAVLLGLPEEIAFRPKKAAQYGSNFDKEIARIAKKKGFRFKGEYVRSLMSR